MSVLGLDLGYTVKYNPLPSGVPSVFALVNSFRRKVIFDRVSLVSSSYGYSIAVHHTPVSHSVASSLPPWQCIDLPDSLDRDQDWTSHGHHCLLINRHNEIAISSWCCYHPCLPEPLHKSSCLRFINVPQQVSLHAVVADEMSI